MAGKRSQCGRVYATGNSPRPLTQLIVVGEHLQYMKRDGEPEAAPPRPSAIFDSALAITGSGAMGVLSQTTFAVVGSNRRWNWRSSLRVH